MSLPINPQTYGYKALASIIQNKYYLHYAFHIYKYVCNCHIYIYLSINSQGSIECPNAGSSNIIPP